MNIRIDVNQIITASGRIIDFNNVDVESIFREDIARGLANVCRYSGQVANFMSVAEHCLLVARAAPLRLKPYALVHDAAEAYMGDVPRPVKLLCPQYKEIEDRVEAAILKRFGIDMPTSSDKAIIKVLDNRSLLLEAMSLKVGDIQQWLDVPGEPLDDMIRCLSPEEAEEAWTAAADMLGVQVL